MAQLDVEKKRPSRRPWILGLLLLVGLGWGITILLTPEEEGPPEVTATTVEDTHPPAAIPRPPEGPVETGAVRPIADLAPLDAEDVGQTARLQGEVIATSETGFWVGVGDQVLHVRSTRIPGAGEAVSLEGRFAALETEAVPIPEDMPGSRREAMITTIELVERVTPGDTAARAAPAGR